VPLAAGFRLAGEYDLRPQLNEPQKWLSSSGIANGSVGVFIGPVLSAGAGTDLSFLEMFLGWDLSLASNMPQMGLAP